MPNCDYFQNGQGKFIERKVHESVKVDGPVGKLKSPLLHYAYTNFNDYAATLDKYAQLSAEEFVERQNKTTNNNDPSIKIYKRKMAS